VILSVHQANGVRGYKFTVRKGLGTTPLDMQPMAFDSDSLSFNDYIPTERRGVSVLAIHLPVFEYRAQFLLDSDPSSSEQILFPQNTSEIAPPPTLTDPLYLYELLLMETPILPQPVTFLPPKWQKIPQQRYEQKQWDYRPAQDILFPVNGQPGVNMGEAFRKRFAALEGRDDLVLQIARTAFSCRIWVCSSCQLDLILARTDVPVLSTLGIRSTNHPR
jgi:hypothetical protein